jgi:hypothetical protein
MPVLDLGQSDDVLSSTPLPTDKLPVKKPPPPPKPEETPAEAAAKTRSIVEGKFPASGAAPEGEHWSNISPPPFQPLPPPPPPEKTSPAEAWGSLAMVAAAIGGAMSRTHATTALNAAAAVMQGFHDKDVEKSKEALERWRIANQNTLASMNYQMEIYKSIMGAQKANILTDISIARETRLEKAADLHAASVALRDHLMQERVEKGDFAGATKLMQDREKLYLKMLKESGNAEDAGEFMVDLNELRQSPEYLAASPLEKYGMELDKLHEMLPDSDNRGDNSAGDRKNAIAVYNTQFKASTGGISSNAPDFEDWYRNTWPTWGGKHLTAQKEKALKGQGDYFQMPDGTWLHYKQTGDKTDQKNWEKVERPEAPPPASAPSSSDELPIYTGP